MPLTVDFDVSQSLASPNELTFSDESTGTDATVTTRRIYVTNAAGDAVVESGTATAYEIWALPLGTDITLDLISRSVALSIKVDWLNVGGTVVYTKTKTYEFTAEDDLFIYGKMQDVASDPSVVQDANYVLNLIKYVVNLVGSENAIENAGDIASAQSCLDRNFNLSTNESFYF